MNTEQEWYVATIKREDGDLLARFAYRHHTVLNDPSYSRTAWFEIESSPVTDLDEYLADLDLLEDQVKTRVERSLKSHLLLVLTGAGYRDLVFALREDDNDVQGAISELTSEYPGRINVNVHQGQKFGPYPTLVSRIKAPV